MKKMILVTAALLAAGAAFGEWRSVGPDGGYVQAFAIDPQEPARLYAAPYEYPDTARLFRSTDAGVSWHEYARMPEQTITYLVVDPFAESLMYAGGRASVVYRSTDAGVSWSPVSLPGYGVVLNPDPLVEGRLYIAGYYSYGGSYRAALYVSTNSGLSWDVAMPHPDTVGYGYGCGTDPVDTGTVYLGANSGQLYKSTDAGATWSRANVGIEPLAATSALSVNKEDNSIVLAITSAGMFRTTDGGASWSEVGGFSYVTSGGFSPADPTVAYTMGMTDSVRVQVSTNYGATWVTPSPGCVGTKVANLVPDPQVGSSAWMSSSYGIHRSIDSGANWNPAHDGLRIGTVSCISASPQDPRRLYLEMYQIAVFRSTCGGDTWDQCGYFLSCGNVCGIGVAGALDRDVLYALEGSG